MTPNDIEILIHCHVSPAPHPRYEYITDVIRQLLTSDLIQHGDEPNSFRTTERGAAHVEQLCDTPWPVQAWVRADGEVIKCYYVTESNSET